MSRRIDPSALIFWLAALVILLGGLGAGALRGSEDRFAEITREMFVRDDFFHPTLNGESHFHKPLLSYWGIAAASVATGTLDEQAARLPSALAAFIALGATISIGRRVWNESVGRLAGWALLTSYGFLFWGRTATAEMENLAAVVVAVAWFFARESRPTFTSYLVFYSICAIGAHAKGLAALVIPLVVAAPWLAREQRWRAHLNTAHLTAGLLAGLVYLAPLAVAELTRDASGSTLDSLIAGDQRSGLYMVFQENVQRFIAPFDHQGPVYTYIAALPQLLLPWTLPFLASLVSTAASWRRVEPSRRWLLEAIAIIFVIFTASGSRRSYYILPILPFCALLIAVGLARRTRSTLEQAALSVTAVALLAIAFVEAAAPAVAAIASRVITFPAPADLVLASSVTGTLALLPWIVAPGRIARLLDVRRDFVRPLLTAVILLGGFFCVQYPILDRFRSEKPFALALRERVVAVSPERIGFVQHVPALFPFYLDLARPVPVLRDQDDLSKFLESGGEWIVASQKGLSRLGDDLPKELKRPPDLEEKVHPWEGPRASQWMAWRVAIRGKGSPGAP